MIKILSTKQIRALDAYTIEQEPIASIDLMERACKAFVTWFTERFDSTLTIAVVCGTGNNGGDGLGIARILNEWGYELTVWIVRGAPGASPDFSANLERLGASVPVNEITNSFDQSLEGFDILIDGMFGSGLSRQAEGVYAQVIGKFNEARAIRVAIDIPSGLMADQHSSGPIVRADYTVSFQLPKLAFYQPENHPYVGKWKVVNIGLNKEFIRKAEPDFFQLQGRDVRKIKKVRSTFDHKGTYGRATIISGSYGKMGATVLASRAALRSGVGLLTVHVPACGYSIMQTAVPEAMVSVDPDERRLTHAPDVQSMDALGIGPGLGTTPESAKALAQVLESKDAPVVIDADALNMIASNSALLHRVPANSILTPHPKEFERLAGPWADDFGKLARLRTFAQEWKVVVVLKGAYSAIATPDGKIRFNPTGNPGMATGGSGDVLTGILTGVLAQGYEPVETALLGVYIHGLAGDLAVIDKGMDGLIASDLVEYLPMAFKRI